FTDAIYRTNQAFEGSLKEAFRVLTAKDPDKARPFDIEAFLQNNGILRPRLLEQMSRYRTEWRNPSTHDYKLDFDEDEALLAIVSVCAFAIILTDQIAEKTSFDRAKASAKPEAGGKSKPLAELAADALLKFRFQPSGSQTGGSAREVEVVGAVAGYLEGVISEAKISTEAPVGSDKRFVADIVIDRNDERVLIEVKRTRFSQNIRGVAISQVSHYVAISGIKEAVLFIYDDQGGELQREDYPLPGADARIVVIAPKRARRPS
ncbi:MAG TPA: hypothetical protein VFQ78_02515, partial [Candidatus Udaeobacter sp.]|nr:hypothetical protein [Candidatus Udaeobacter sp.]